MAKIAVCLIAKDEEHYLLEWMAYNLVLGFDEILVYDNDSVDGTRRLVEQASAVDRRIRCVPWPDLPGLSPQVTAYNHALGNTDADWIAFIDADEFIVLREHDTIGDFLAGFDESTGAVCLHWRLFGSSGHTTHADDLVVRRFTRCANEYNLHVKSIVRRACMAQMHVHVGRLSSGTHVDATGAPVTPQAEIEPIPSRHPASINHYVLKSAEEYRVKVARGEGSKAPDSPNRRAKFTPEFWHRHDRNDVEDFAIARFIPALEIEMARLLSGPGPVSDNRWGAWHHLKTLFAALRTGPTRRGACSVAGERFGDFGVDAGCRHRGETHMGRMMKLAMAGLAVMGAYKLAKGGRGRNDEVDRGGEDAIAGRDPARDRWDEVDEASYESFPASDPPSYSRGGR